MQDLDFQRITIEDKAKFEKLFSVCQPTISEYTFTNLLIWSQPKELLYAPYEEGVIIKASDHGQDYFMPPVGYNDCQNAFHFMIEYGIEKGIREIRRVPEYQKKFLKKFPTHIHPDRGNYDYVYKTESLATLKGWRLDGKRGFVKKFKENYEYQYHTYSENWKDACLDLAVSWADAKKAQDPSVMSELTAIREMLEHYASLDLAGGVLTVSGKVIAFTFGEKLNDTTAVIHFEKADHTFTGSYQMINQLFVQNEIFGKYLFVNREQDLGIEGIRKAKLSYVPIRLLKKYLVLY